MINVSQNSSQFIRLIDLSSNLPTSRKFLLILIGLGLCSSIPIIAIGPSFIIWPSTSEMSALLLLLMSVTNNFSKPQDTKNTIYKVHPQINIFIRLTFIYVLTLTFFVTLSSNLSLVYPVWSVARFTQWLIIIPYLLLVCSSQQINLLSLGIILGSLLNSFAAIAQRFGFLSVADLVSHIGSAAGSGPWGTIYNYGGIISGESIGVFTYSRTATGFFLGISLLLVARFFKKSYIKLIFAILISIAIFFTGSRLGFFSLILSLISFIKSRNNFWIGMILVFTAFFILSLNSGALMEDDIIGRMFGYGTGNYEEGFEGRAERQSIVFGLPLISLILGCGLGNLGNASGLADIGFNFYRAHGFFLTYLSEIGITGSVLLGFTTYLLIKKFKFSFMTWSLIIAITLSGFSDDFMVPSGPSGQIPIIIAIILRMTARKTNDDMKNE